ncbi:growth factor receptor-bound protein 10-like isoform X5 [Lates japonicus]|uniref:Growth factor receptor-bound protein 10-like isoform X5 n=1 Tax=Lates japonicus TaxID=270547 RepID=A0AAD3NFK5_LATJO|nr:growth factor receptor-bound protein 10-like isoform X5 [Lates japonicus]
MPSCSPDCCLLRAVEIVKIFSEDGMGKVVEIPADMTARDLCQLLALSKTMTGGSGPRASTEQPSRFLFGRTMPNRVYQKLMAMDFSREMGRVIDNPVGSGAAMEEGRGG